MNFEVCYFYWWNTYFFDGDNADLLNSKNLGFYSFYILQTFYIPNTYRFNFDAKISVGFEIILGSSAGDYAKFYANNY